ncbi:AMP-binding protein [Nocardia sp. NPDC059691]|uniref:AMP-binding protein n=1 Tax=Nocardia sp. NPDC059691 TaxID=3346908 RepID=UPI0036B8554D
MSFKSPFPDVEIPSSTVYDFLFGRMEEVDFLRSALIDGGTGATISFRSLIDQIDSVAGALATRGLAVGDVAAVHMPNVPEFASIIHGILRAGGTATPVHALYTAEEIANQLVDSKARFLFTMSALLPQAAIAAEAAGIVAGRLIVVDGSEGYPSLGDLLADRSPVPQIVIDPATHIALLPYSSGTTGKPKGVMLTHRNLVANLCQLEPLMDVGPGHHIIAVLPFFHIYGFNTLLNAGLHRRATIITMSKFDLKDFLTLVATWRCTYLYVAPPIVVALAKHPMIESFDLSSIRTILCAAAALDEQLGRAVAARLGCRVRQAYGMTEMSPASHGIPENRDDIPHGSIGLTMANIECKLIDLTTGDEIDPPAEGLSQPGELCCKGPNVMAGYLGRDDATVEVIDQDGFLHTGDVARVNSEGVVFIVDRLKELIKYKGYQVPPAELEAVLLSHPAIADAAVIGVRNADGEEHPKAFVVQQPDTRLEDAEVMDFVAERVAPHKRVRAVEFIDSVPRSVAGKILRKNLKELEASRAATT